MKIFNGTDFRVVGAEELAEMEGSARVTALEQRNSPMTDGQVLRLLLARQVNTLKVDDNTALRMAEFYPAWCAEEEYAVGFAVTCGGRLWRCVQGHVAQTGWEPEKTPALWQQVCFHYAATVDDPIPYEGNMVLEQGKHYFQNGVIYVCTRDSGNAVTHSLADLVGLYVEAV